MIRYGKPDCPHTWRYRFNSLENEFEDECIPVICVTCGAFGCACDVKEYVSNKVFFSEAQKYDANINGKWVNPYVEEILNEL
jgi:hypothetical protein